MKLKLLLFGIFLSGMLNAQDTIRSLVITEAYVGCPERNFIEVTNMGDEPIQLSNFRVASERDNNNGTYPYGDNEFIDFPEYLLQPGESYIVAHVRDWTYMVPEQGYNILNDKEWVGTPEAIRNLVDLPIHVAENNWPDTPTQHPLDSVTLNSAGQPAALALQAFFGRICTFIVQKLDSGDVVIDQVYGVWDDDRGNGNYRNSPVSGWEGAREVAGFAAAGTYGHIIRKFSVKTGNKEFVRGVGEGDSEWIVIPKLMSSARMQPWTLKNHGDFNLDENTLVPTLEGMEVDFMGKTITVPWGLRKPDDIMANLEEKPGLAMYYICNSNLKDSLSFGIKTGDKLAVVVCGMDADRDTFNIVVKNPLPTDNLVIPGSAWDPLGEYQDNIEYNFNEWPVVTRNESGMDTIRGYLTQRYNDIPNPVKYYGIPYATRVDSLLAMLEKPEKAKWEIVFVDGAKRADLKHGDKLKITSENGSVKEYFIAVEPYKPSDNFQLASIRWPDIPQWMRGQFGWIGDTIPNFAGDIREYQVTIPPDIDEMPALVAAPVSNNAKIKVDRATNISGTVEQRSTVFTVTAEDEVSVASYVVELKKDKLPQDLQPFSAEPFLSGLGIGWQFGNCYIEICNPGNQPLDLSDYLIAHVWANGNPAEAITRLGGANDWLNRYAKYVPGYKWQNEMDWQISPGLLESDLAVNSIVLPGDVFCMGYIRRNTQVNNMGPDYYWPTPDQMDVQFANSIIEGIPNPWNENTGEVPIPTWTQGCIYMFKILNDSVKMGLKPATDPDDFELVESFSMQDGSAWKIGGKSGGNGFAVVRKPEITKPNPEVQASFGATPEESEWLIHDANYWRSIPNIPFNMVNFYGGLEFGYHNFIAPSEFMSTVGAEIYKVSEGYGMNERIWGIVTGTSASDFLANIVKHDPNQTLTLISGADGSELAMDALVSMNDTLVVLSADGTNTTKYKLEVSDTGLNSNAVLTSDKYEVTINVQPKSAGELKEAGSGIVTGFEYGTLLKTVIQNVTLPSGATLAIINEDGGYQPLTAMNFKLQNIAVTVNPEIYFEVTAEDFVTKIIYQLLPATMDDAILTSDKYKISQADKLIEFVPAGTYAAGGWINVSNFLSHLVPSEGATLKLIDKYGLERTDGVVVQDDKVLVTSANGSTTNVYHISFLPNEFVSSTTYLAYILSNVYSIDQVSYEIKGVSGSATINEFLSKISTSRGATAVVVDANGNEKTTGDIDGGDQVKVTSVDGKITVMYTFGNLTSTVNLDENQIVLYPNPTNGKINISGVKPGGRIQVYNSVGTLIRDFNLDKTLESVSLEKEPAGMYLIVVSEKDKMLGNFKVIRQ